MVSQRYRADFYLFRQFMAGLGTFHDRKVLSCRSLKLVFGVNRPFRIRLDGHWVKARTILLDSHTPHYLNGRGDWQVVVWIDNETALAALLQSAALAGRSWAVQAQSESRGTWDVVQTVGDRSDAQGALKVIERLLQVYTGAQAVPSTWDSTINALVMEIDSDPGNWTVQRLAESKKLSVEALHNDAWRVLGEGLDLYLHRRKLSYYFRLRRQGVSREEALRFAGLPGWEGLRDRFEERTGLDFEVLDESRPFVRMYDGGDDQPCRYL